MRPRVDDVTIEQLEVHATCAGPNHVNLAEATLAVSAFRGCEGVCELVTHKMRAEQIRHRHWFGEAQRSLGRGRTQPRPLGQVEGMDIELVVQGHELLLDKLLAHEQVFTSDSRRPCGDREGAEAVTVLAEGHVDKDRFRATDVDLGKLVTVAERHPVNNLVKKNFELYIPADLARPAVLAQEEERIGGSRHGVG